MNKELFKQYAVIKVQIKELEEKSKEIEKEVMNEMQTQEIEQVKSDFGTFSITKRKVWKYSNDTKTIEEGLKRIKKIEEEDGTATFEEKIGLMFRNTNIK